MNTFDVDLSNNPLKAQYEFLILRGGYYAGEEKIIRYGTIQSKIQIVLRLRYVRV